MLLNQLLGFRHVLLAKCQRKQRLQTKDASISSLNRNAELRTRNLASRVSCIDRTEARATRPSLSDMKRFSNCKY
jgi:hypothetical protein